MHLSRLKIRSKHFSHRLSHGLLNRLVLQGFYQHWRVAWEVHQLQENRAGGFDALYVTPKQTAERNHLEPVRIWNPFRFNELPKSAHGRICFKILPQIAAVKKNSRKEWLMWKTMSENKISSKCFGEKWIYAAGNRFIMCGWVFDSFKVGFISSSVLHI